MPCASNIHWQYLLQLSIGSICCRSWYFANSPVCLCKPFTQQPVPQNILLPVQAYKNYIQKLLTRVNTITGVTYKDDPTFFALELANEPHCNDGYEISLGITPGTIVRAWVAEMAAYIRSLDPNHMVSYLSGTNLRYEYCGNGGP